MAIRLVSRAGRAFLAGTLVFLLGLAPAFAHMAAPLAAAPARPALAASHGELRVKG